MTTIINPGSGQVAQSGEGWTNTWEHALTEAQAWLERMTADGIRDVELDLDISGEQNNGRWRFAFRHTVTDRYAWLETHGIDNLDAYRKGRLFDPKVYWDGSSTAEPKVEDWLTDGYEVVKTLRRIAPAEGANGPGGATRSAESPGATTEVDR